MSLYSNKTALTIHKKIYIQVEDANGGLQFELQKNIQTDTVFIIDEASMISDERSMGTNGLLRDLINYVFEADNNKIIFIGDAAQLPPVSMNISPALDVPHLRDFYRADVMDIELEDVMRQAQGSGILNNATDLRKNLQIEKFEIGFLTKGYKDIFKLPSERFEEGIRYAYDKFGQENTIIITRSNKNAVQFNKFIRNQINYSENELEVGDMLMVVKNNYTILDEASSAGFIANGEFVIVKHLGREENMHDFRFQEATLQMVDYPDEPEFETLIFLDTLYSNSPSLTQEENRKLYDRVMQDYFFIKSKTERNKLVKKDKYLNALQVKFAYALTCHKSQGGQWEAVFIDQGYLPENTVDQDFMRWTYTALTRASKEVFLMNFNNQFFI